MNSIIPIKIKSNNISISHIIAILFADHEMNVRALNELWICELEAWMVFSQLSCCNTDVPWSSFNFSWLSSDFIIRARCWANGRRELTDT